MSATKHKQVSITWQDRQAEVDKGLAPLILALWKLDIDTCNSCQENMPGIAWIEFLTSMDAEEFLNIVAVHPEEFDAAPSCETMYDRIVGCGTEDDWQYDAHAFNYGVDEEIVGDEVGETPIGPTDFGFSISIRFPRTDLPLIQERLNQALSERFVEEDVSA
jgi:hypothetical protein